MIYKTGVMRDIWRQFPIAFLIYRHLILLALARTILSGILLYLIRENLLFKYK